MALLEVQSATAATKLSHIEARTMSENLKPHEFVRLTMRVHDEFTPESDGSWALRSIRDIALEYTRVLQRIYTLIGIEEMIQLVRLFLFEADGFIVVLWWFYSGFIVV